MNITGSTEEAVEVWRRHVQRDPMLAQGHHHLGSSYLYLAEPDYRSAIAPLERAIELGAVSPMTTFYLATAYAQASEAGRVNP